MKLLSTEIDDQSVQLTYTDGPAVDDAKMLMILRMPIPGPMARPVLWHHLHILRQAQDLIDQEARRVRDELERQQ